MSAATWTSTVARFVRQLPLWLVPLLLILVGTIGLFDRLAFGKAGLALTSFVPWGLWIGAYVFLVWLEVGSLIVFGLLYYHLGFKSLQPIKTTVYLAGGLILIMALITVGLDLGQMWRVWRVFLTPDFGSPMTWMIWLHTIYLVLIVLKLWAAITGRDAMGRALFHISLPIGVLLLATIGGIFGFSASRPFWNISVLPLHFVIVALAAGTAVLAIQIYLFRRDLEGARWEDLMLRLRPYLLGLMLFGGFAALLNFLMIVAPRMPQQLASLQLALFGPYWWSFWLLHVVLGVLVPILLLLFLRRPRVTVVAAVLIVAGFSALPPNIIIPALATEALTGLASAYQDHRLHMDYAPSWTEWLVLVFVTGIGWLGFLLVRPLVRSSRFASGSAREASS